jgi:hypothetical protein
VSTVTVPVASTFKAEYKSIRNAGTQLSVYKNEILQEENLFALMLMLLGIREVNASDFDRKPGYPEQGSSSLSR